MIYKYANLYLYLQKDLQICFLQKSQPKGYGTTAIYMLLQTIQSPQDLRKLSVAELPTVCEELRQFIIEQVAQYGGHLGASLGVVELTVALHYVFDTPHDKLVWDVGHQAYGHKIITGRRDIFHTNRKLGGISGFPKRSESVYDAFGTGHSSTSLSAILGMALAAQLVGDTARQHIAVLGDGGLTAGMVYEAMNHAGGLEKQPNILLIFNNNGMSIDKNVGALHQKFNAIGKNGEQTSKSINKEVRNFFSFFNFKTLNTTDSAIDGHDVIELVAILEEQKKQKGLQILHCKTIKGKGYTQAETDQITWHAPGLFDKLTGEIHKKLPQSQEAPKYQDVFGHTLVELARVNPKIVGITPAMLSGSSMRLLLNEFPERTFDVGIAEQHAVTLAAGFAADGFLPYCNIYSSFLQRGYDQVIHDVCLQNLKVVFCLDRGGLVGADGGTHHGAFDLAFLRCVPNLIVAAPLNEVELRNMLFTAQFIDCQAAMAIRYPRGKGVMPDWKQPFELLQIGKGQCINTGGSAAKIAILSVGHVGNFVIKAMQEKQNLVEVAAHYDMRFVKPLDTALLLEIANQFTTLITVEDGAMIGGFGSAVAEFLAANRLKNRLITLGIPDTFIEHGEPEELHKLCGFDSESIAKLVESLALR
jgi:1-deoxy-D-xylulose-5-phosphate synthase